MNEKIYRIGTRKSRLALKQVDEILGLLKNFYPGIKTEVTGIDTYGDKDKSTPISAMEGTDFFTREIDEALLSGKIDFAVHSAKDLPYTIPDGLYVTAITQSMDPYDAIVSRDNVTIENLKINARIGASSARRKDQLRKYRSDFMIIDVRGTIEERLKKLDEIKIDAIIVAAIALVRLGLEEKITQRIPFEILRPHPLQGCLAVMARKQDKDLIKMFEKIGENSGNG
ncbi:MAG: hydroxymethylbilane synthase [Candidatus Omnitrophica bacterium]|nr:hydroxymethylbilane synthase [Candidatus Omnitrophota bacterium]